MHRVAQKFKIVKWRKERRFLPAMNGRGFRAEGSVKKEEFPTFLNEQPKIIFGRTARELLMIVLGAAGSYTLWGSISHLRPEGWWGPSCLVVCALLFISSIVLPMINIGTRPLEVWLAAWMSYALIPKVYLYRQLEEEAVTVEEQQGARGQKRGQPQEEPAIFEE